jgi:hypothetical protein
LLGALVTAYVGSIAGAVCGTILGRLLAWLGWHWPGTVAMTLLGACVGAGAVAYTHDSNAALAGLWHGAVGGAVGCVVVVVGSLAYLRVVLSGGR